MLVTFLKTNDQRDSYLPFEIQVVQVKISTISKYKVQEEAVPKEEKQKER